MTQREPCGAKADAYPEIKDLAAIGNGHTVALINRTGTIEWWCPVRFDHPSIFASILDRRKGGRFDCRVEDVEDITRSYVGDTNVLRTMYLTSTGTAELVDFMPIVGDADELRPPHALMRSIRCTEGTVSLNMTCAPRFQYGRRVPRTRRIYPNSVRFAAGNEVLVVRSDRPMELDGDAAAIVTTLSAGEACWASLSYADSEPVIIPPVGEAAARVLSSTLEFWQNWSEQCTYEGSYREAVVRSALILKMLQFAPSGALVAAPTTSLPEEIGGARNWDYRYCWLRDASLAIRALLSLGYRDEARAYLGWIFHATYLTWPALQVLYDLYGRTNIPERKLPDLEGYCRSAPVHVGNHATEQLQLDAYAEVITAAHEYVMSGGELARGQLKRLVQLGKKVIELWKERDQGIWEVRSMPRHHVHSKVMCWRALDNLLTMHTHGHMEVPVNRFRRECDRIRDDIETNGFDESLGSYVQAYESRIADASLLVLPLHRYLAADHPKMQSTFVFLKEHLESNRLWYRYPPGSDDGLPGTEATFGMCSFLAVDVLARSGRTYEAERLFEHLLNLGSDLGLYGEEIDEATGAALGNYPQAFTHIGLINAAISLEPTAGKKA